MNRRLAVFAHILDDHYTMLAVVAIGITGTALYFIASYICRYNAFDWWRWKQRAVFGNARLWTVLLLLKLLLRTLG